MLHLFAALPLLSPAPLPPDETPVGLDPVASNLAAARAAYSRRELGAAHNLLRDALEEAPGEPGVRLWLGRVLNDLRHADEAVSVLRPALEILPDSAWLLTEYGRARRLQGDAAAAEQAFRAALQSYPRCGAARLHLVDLLVDSDRAEDAQQVFEPLLAQAADDPSVVIAHAALLQGLGRVEEAETRLRDAVDDDAARVALGQHLAERGRYPDAWEVVEPLLEDGRDPDTLTWIAQLARRSGRTVEALSILGAALVEDPTHTLALEELLDLLARREELRTRLAELRLESRPDDASAWCDVLEMLLEKSRLEDFFARLERAPASLRASPAIRTLEGRALRRSGRTGEAREVLESLAATHDSPRAWYELGLLEYAEGRLEPAVHAFAHGADGTWEADANFNRGVCLDRLGRFADAAEAYDAAVLARPGFVEAWLQLGADYRYRLGDSERAKEAYRRYLELGGDDPEVRRFVGEER